MFLNDIIAIFGHHPPLPPSSSPVPHASFPFNARSSIPKAPSRKYSALNLCRTKAHRPQPAACNAARTPRQTAIGEQYMARPCPDKRCDCPHVMQYTRNARTTTKTAGAHSRSRADTAVAHRRRPAYPHIRRFTSDIPPRREIRFYKSKTVFWKSLRLPISDDFSFFNIIRNAPTRISISRLHHSLRAARHGAGK